MVKNLGKITFTQKIGGKFSFFCQGFRQDGEIESGILNHGFSDCTQSFLYASCSPVLVWVLPHSICRDAKSAGTPPPSAIHVHPFPSSCVTYIYLQTEFPQLVMLFVDLVQTNLLPPWRWGIVFKCLRNSKRHNPTHHVCRGLPAIPSGRGTEILGIAVVRLRQDSLIRRRGIWNLNSHTW